MTYLNSLDSLANFKKDIIEPLVRGASVESVPFSEGYREIYEQWTEVVGSETLLKMNPDDRLLSFTDYIRDENKRMAEKAAKSKFSPAERKRFTQAVARGQFLRVQGKKGRFDKIIASYELDKANSLTTYAVSDTCVSTTTDWPGVCDQQSALLFASKLREQHFLVQSIEPGRPFKAEVIHPKTGTFTVNVDLNQPPTEVLVFSFTNPEGQKKVVSMNQLGDAYGIIEDTFGTVQNVMEAGGQAVGQQLMLNGANTMAALEAARIGALAAMAMREVKNRMAQPEEGYSDEATGMPGTVLPDGSMVPDIQAAKSNVMARQENQSRLIKDGEDLSGQAYEKYKESVHEAKEYKDERRETIQKRMAGDQKTQKKGMAIMAGTLAGSGATGALLSWLTM